MLRGFLCLLLLLAPLVARAQSYRISDFHDSIAVTAKDVVQVEERIRFAFQGSFHGVHRRIPLQYPDKFGSNFTLQLGQISVRDENGSPLKFKQAVSHGFLVLTIYIPGAEDVEKTVDIQYTVFNGVRFFDQHAEFYWNVTGNDWSVPIDSASVFLKLPDTAAGKLKAQAMTGAYGSTAQDATVTVDGSAVTVQSNHALDPHEGLTVDLYLPPGVIAEPGPLQRFWYFMLSNLILVLPLFAFAVMFGLWYAIGRDPDPGISVAPQYEPPKGLTPVECGTVIDDSIDARDIVSILVDLAVRGYLKIEETQGAGILHHTRDYTFHMSKPRDQWNDLAPFELTVMDNIFGTLGEAVSLSSLKNNFYLAMPAIQQQVMSALEEKGLYKVDPATAKGYTAAASLCIVLPFLAAQVLGFYNFLRAPVPLIVCALLTAGIVFGFGRLLTAKSVKGTRLLVAVKGFKEFMMRVDGNRLRNYPPETFEKYLPYAMALGVERHWAKAFEGIVKDPPTWYVGPATGNLFNTLLFMDLMSNMSSATFATFTSTPAPQANASGGGFGDGGFGGGGFSGGGFGGGGGDAF
jgi:uncharacterized membrane protein